MALSQEKFSEIVYSFQDMEGTQARMQIHAPGAGHAGLGIVGASLLDDLELWAVGNFGAWALGDLIAKVGALSDCEICRVSLSQGFYDDVPAVGTGESEQVGVFVFEDANGLLQTITIPDPPEAILQPNLRYIDPAHTAVVEFVDEVLLDAVLDTKAEVQSFQKAQLALFVEGYKAHTSSVLESYRRTG